MPNQDTEVDETDRILEQFFCNITFDGSTHDRKHSNDARIKAKTALNLYYKSILLEVISDAYGEDVSEFAADLRQRLESRLGK